ncbi:MAG: HupE/UreJ family protein [Polyangiaceae bacterium]
MHLVPGSGSTTELTAMLTVARPSVDVPSHGGEGTPGVPSSAPARAPSSAPAFATVRSYFLAGAEHLITGLDHVLFVLGLLLLLRRPAPIARAVTAFTVAHSITLALTVLGAVRLPPAPVEAAIALSVLFLAREILRPRDHTTLLSRRPWVAAFAFGLLHGLGFAGGLASFHLAREGLALALLGFNLGLEAAQLGLILVALAVARPLARLALRKPAWTLRAPAYSLGAAAAFWVFQRVAAFWSS